MPSPKSLAPEAEKTEGSEIIIQNNSHQAIQIGPVFVGGKVGLADQGSQFRLIGLFKGGEIVGGKAIFEKKEPKEVEVHVMKHIARRLRDGHLRAFASTVPAGTSDTLAALRTLGEPKGVDEVIAALEIL
jgi:hypothetical protein